MRVVYEYSHLGGAEILQVKYPDIDAAIGEVIEAVGSSFRSKVSLEERQRGKLLYAPTAMNAAFKVEFQKRGFQRIFRSFKIEAPQEEGKLLDSSREIDFAKDRVLVEVQFGKYAFMFYDMAKLEHFYREDHADLGVEILPSYVLQRQMSSGPGRGEMLIHDIIDSKRQYPAFPVKVILIEP